MTMLSGLVAILDDKGNVIGTKNLGPVPVEVKASLVKPLTESKPILSASEQYTAPVYSVTANGVTATYSKEAKPIEPPSLESRIAALEAKVFAK